MPPRDEEDFERKRQQIIDGAMHVFSTKGFEAATNKDIAHAAGIGSPGLIYHYFKDKADLFRQVVQQRAPVLRLLDHDEDLMDMPPREALTLFSSQLISMFDNKVTVAMFRLMLSEAVRKPALADILNKVGPYRGIAFLRKYLERQMELGVLRPMDSGAAVRCLIGPIIGYALLREVFIQPDSRSLTAQTMVTTMIDAFLDGMLLERSRD